MSSNYVSEGDRIPYSNTGGAIAAGAVVKMDNTLGVALVNIAATTGVGTVAVEGVFSGLPKASAAVFAQGAKLDWDVSGNGGKGEFVATLGASQAEGDVTGAAIAWLAGSNGQTTCTVKLTPGNTDIKPAG